MSRSRHVVHWFESDVFFLLFFSYVFSSKANVEYWMSFVCALCICCTNSYVEWLRHCHCCAKMTPRTEPIFLPVHEQNRTSRYYYWNVNRRRQKKNEWKSQKIHNKRSAISLDACDCGLAVGIFFTISTFLTRNAVDSFHWAWNWKQLWFSVDV